MVSGAIFLDCKKEISIKNIYLKYILRLLIIFVLWSTFYSLINNYCSKTFNVKDILKDIILGNYHMWFIYMIIGLYMIIPILRKIIEDKKVTQYFLILWIIASMIILPLTKIQYFGNIILAINEKINMSLILGYSGYFILGYYLANKELKYKKLIYFLGILGALITITGTSIIHHITNSYNLILYGNLTLNVLLTSVSIFVFFKDKIKNNTFNEKKNKIIEKISRYSLGVYLIHPMIIFILSKIGISTLKFNPIVSVIGISILVYSISLLISWGLNKIPKINKYIV